MLLLLSFLPCVQPLRPLGLLCALELNFFFLLFECGLRLFFHWTLSLSQAPAVVLPSWCAAVDFLGFVECRTSFWCVCVWLEAFFLLLRNRHL